MSGLSKNIIFIVASVFAFILVLIPALGLFKIRKSVAYTNITSQDLKSALDSGKNFYNSSAKPLT